MSKEHHNQDSSSVPFSSTEGGSHPFGPFGIVLIGRNEGERLVRALASVKHVPNVVYVDSGSTDQSVVHAKTNGAKVVELDMSIPFTAARARNAGFALLKKSQPCLKGVFFFDGDCEVQQDFLEVAKGALESHSDVVAVCGIRRERQRNASLYNRVCDMEWQMERPGDAFAFGGDVLIRASTFEAVGGYNEKVIAAEDTELSLRLKRLGRLIRVANVSTIHDAAMHTFDQWFKRAKRAGHAYAQVHDMHGQNPEKCFEREVARVWNQGILLPVISVGAVPVTMGASLLGLGAYPLLAVKTAIAKKKEGYGTLDAIVWGVSCTASKIPEALGWLEYQERKRKKKAMTLIEYK